MDMNEKKVTDTKNVSDTKAENNVMESLISVIKESFDNGSLNEPAYHSMMSIATKARTEAAQVKTESTESEEPKEEPVSESKSFDDVVKTICEAYNDNKITKDEKNKLLAQLVEKVSAVTEGSASSDYMNKATKASISNDKVDTNDASPESIKNDITNIDNYLTNIRSNVDNANENQLKTIKKEIVKMFNSAKVAAKITSSLTAK